MKADEFFDKYLQSQSEATREYMIKTIGPVTFAFAEAYLQAECARIWSFQWIETIANRQFPDGHPKKTERWRKCQESRRIKLKRDITQALCALRSEEKECSKSASNS